MFHRKVTEKMIWHDVVNKINDVHNTVEYKIFGFTVYKRSCNSINEVIGKTDSVGFKK